MYFFVNLSNFSSNCESRVKGPVNGFCKVLLFQEVTANIRILQTKIYTIRSLHVDCLHFNSICVSHFIHYPFVKISLFWGLVFKKNHVVYTLAGSLATPIHSSQQTERTTVDLVTEITYFCFKTYFMKTNIYIYICHVPYRLEKILF